MRTSGNKGFKRFLALFLAVYLTLAPLGQIALAQEGQEKSPAPKIRRISVEEAKNKIAAESDVEQSGDSILNAAGGLEGVTFQEQAEAQPPKDEEGYYIRDEYTDVLDLGENEQRLKIYSYPRPLYRDEQGHLHVREPGWNLFDVEDASRLNQSENGGYTFQTPNTIGETVGIQSGALEYENSGQFVAAETENFRQETEDGNLERVSIYENIYPNIDVQFNDVKQYRYKSIILKEAPKNLDKSDALIFWETYNLPEGTTVETDEGPITGEEIEIKNSAVYIALADGNTFTIGSALVFDASDSDASREDLPQILHWNKEENLLQIGIKIGGQYLHDSARVYPVTIDPVYYYCQGSNRTNCSITDLYLRYLISRDTTRPDLWVGYYNDNGSPATRHPVIKFNINYPSNISSVRTANVWLTASSTRGAGTYNGSVNTQAYQIRDSWTTSNITYNAIRGNLLASGGQRSIEYNSNNGLYSWDILNMVNHWISTPSQNYGLLIEPLPRWTSGTIPSWPNRLYVFYSSRDSQNRGPYMVADILTNNMPDLTGNGSSIDSDNTKHPGEFVTTTIRVRNDGGAASNSGRVSIYMKQGTRVFDSQYEVARASYNSIPAGGTFSQQVSWQLPHDMPSGDYWVYFWIDSLYQTSESDEGNNRFFFSSQKNVSPGADLTKRTDSAGSLTPAPGDTINYSITLENTSTSQVESGGGRVRVYFKEGTVSYSSAYEIDSFGYAARSPGASLTSNRSFVVPSNTSPGNYKLYYWIDADGETNETDESNNQFEWNITVQNNNNDVRANNLNVIHQTRIHSVGDRLQISADLQNVGGAINDVPYRIVLRDINNSSIQFPLTNLSPSNIDFGANFNGTMTLFGNIPSNTTVDRDYDVRITLDPNNTINDTNPANNSITENNSVRVVSALTDLSVRDATLQTTGIRNPDDWLSVQVRMRNEGTVDANNIQYRLYMRDVVTNSLYPLDPLSPLTVSLNAGADVYRTVNGVIPTNAPYYRNYLIEVGIDPNQQFNDPTFSNNTTRTTNSFYLEPTNYGGGGGGGTPPPSTCNVRGLLDTDCDNYADLEEKTGGTNVSGTQTLNLYDTDYRSYLATQTDHRSGTYGADPVNLRTGAFEFTQTDFELPGRGMHLNFERTYNSTVPDFINRLGFGWNFSYNTYYFQDPATSNVLVNLGNRQSALFTFDSGSGTFIPPIGVDATLSGNATSGFTYRTLDAIEYRFSRVVSGAMGVLESVVDSNGNTTQLNYTNVRDVPLLTSVADPSGRIVQLSYGDATDPIRWDKIIRLEETVNSTSAERRIVIYTYDENGDLIRTSSTRAFQGNVENIVRNFTYDGNHRMLTYTDPRGTILTNEYDSDGRVIRQYEFNPDVDASAPGRRVYELDYINGAYAPAPTAVRCTLVRNFRDATNFYTTRQCYNSNELVVLDEDGANNRTSYSYNGDGMVISRTDPNGNVSTYGYDARRRMTFENMPDISDHAGRNVRKTTNYSYEDTFNRMTLREEVVRDLDANAVVVQRRNTYSIDSNNGNILAIARSLTSTLNATENFTYDSFGNVRTHTDANGNTTTYTYDTGGNYLLSESIANVTKQYQYDIYGNRTRYTSPRQNVTNFVYDTHGNVRSKTLPANGGTWTYEYDEENHLIRQTDGLGRVTEWSYLRNIPASVASITKKGIGGNIGLPVIPPDDYIGDIVQRFEYDFVGNKVREINPRGMTTTFTYDAANRIITQSDPFTTVNYTYDANSNITRETNSASQRTDFVYNSLNDPTSIRRYIDATNFVEERLAYDGLGRTIIQTDGRNNTVTSAYDLGDRLLSVRDEENQETRYTYDNNGNRLSVRDKNGNSTTYEYDALNRIIRMVNADNKITTTEYDTDSNVVRVVDRMNSDGTQNTHVMTYEYDALNRMTRDIDALNNDMVYTYDAIGNRLSSQDKEGNITRFEYDVYHRLIRQIDPANQTTHFIRDENDNIIQEFYPDGTVLTRVFDSKGRMTSLTDELAGQRVYTYDAADNLLTERDKNNNTTTFAYDGLNRLRSERNANNVTTTYTYDANGNRLTETTNAKVRTWTYTPRNQIATMSEGGQQLMQYSYDANQNITRTVDGEGNEITYSYDALNRNIQKTLPGTITVTYTYDNWDNTTRTGDPNLDTSRTFDLLNRVTNEELTFARLPGRTYTIARTYDANGDMTSITDAAGRRFNYTYDARRLMQTVAFNTTTLATYAYTNMQRPATVTYGNGVTSALTYDELNRVTEINLQNSRGTSLLRHQYAYDAESNRTRLIEDATRTITYQYDPLHQLIAVDYDNIPGTGNDISYAYDSWGNRTNYRSPFTSVASTYAGDSQRLATMAYNNGKLAVTVTHDADGNLTQESFARHGITTRSIDYTYDAEHRLTAIQYAYNRPAFLPALPAESVNYEYEDSGNRIRKEANGAITYYINSGIKVLNELAANGNPSKSIVQGLDQVAEIDVAGTITYLHQDVLGSTMVVTDSTGAPVQRYEYAPFGETIGADGNTPTNYQFTGQEADTESGLIYMNARYYNPRTGRFLSQDVIKTGTGNVLDYNPYIYTLNNPLRFVDPTGYFSFDLFWTGTKQATFGALNTVFGGAEVIAGGAMSSTLLGAVPGVPLMALGGNNVVAGTTEGASGAVNIWNSIFNDEAAAVDYTYNPAHEAIDALTETNTTTNTAAHISYDVVDIIAGGAGIKKGASLGISKIEGIISGSGRGGAAIGATGVIGENALSKLGGAPQVFTKTTQGRRYIDQVIQGIAHESKVGYVSGSKAAKQIAKDKEILASGKYSGYVWDFFRSPVTGKIGPSKPIQNLLNEAGIVTRMHNHAGIVNSAIGAGVVNKVFNIYHQSTNNYSDNK